MIKPTTAIKKGMDLNKIAIISQRTYNITYNIHSILRHLFISIGLSYRTLKKIKNICKDIHIMWGVLLYAS